MTIRTVQDDGEGLAGERPPIKIRLLPQTSSRDLLSAGSSVAPQVSWSDLLIAAGTATGALLLLTALLRLCNRAPNADLLRAARIDSLHRIFPEPADSRCRHPARRRGGGVARVCDVRPPVRSRRLRIGVAAAASRSCGSLIRSKPFCWRPRWSRRSCCCGTATHRGMLMSLPPRRRNRPRDLGRAVDVAYYGFTPGWEKFQAKSASGCASPNMSGELSREADERGVRVGEWSHNDYGLVTNWMFAIPDTFSAGRVSHSPSSLRPNRGAHGLRPLQRDGSSPESDLAVRRCCASSRWSRCARFLRRRRAGLGRCWPSC